MKKQLTSKTVYEPNEFVKVTVVNKPKIDPGSQQRAGYFAEVTIKVKRPLKVDELIFKDDEDIATFLETIDVSDPQESLPLE